MFWTPYLLIRLLHALSVALNMKRHILDGAFDVQKLTRICLRNLGKMKRAKTFKLGQKSKSPKKQTRNDSSDSHMSKTNHHPRSHVSLLQRLKFSSLAIVHDASLGALYVGRVFSVSRFLIFVDFLILWIFAVLVSFCGLL